MATHASILAGIIPWTEEPGGLLPWGHKEQDTTKHTIEKKVRRALDFWFAHLHRELPRCCSNELIIFVKVFYLNVLLSLIILLLIS